MTTIDLTDQERKLLLRVLEVQTHFGDADLKTLKAKLSAEPRPPNGETFSAYMRRTGITWTDYQAIKKETKN